MSASVVTTSTTRSLCSDPAKEVTSVSYHESSKPCSQPASRSGTSSRNTRLATMNALTKRRRSRAGSQCALRAGAPCAASAPPSTCSRSTVVCMFFSFPVPADHPSYKSGLPVQSHFLPSSAGSRLAVQAVVSQRLHPLFGGDHWTFHIEYPETYTTPC